MNPSTLLADALQAHRLSDFKLALEKYSTLVSDQNLFASLPSNERESVALNYSSLLRKFGKIDESILFLNSCLKNFSHHNHVFKAGLLNNLGNLYFDREDYLQASLQYRQSITFNPTSFDARQSLSQCLFKLKCPNLSYKILLDGYQLASSLEDGLRYMQPLANILIELKDRFDEDDTSLLKFAESLEQNLPRLCKDKDSSDAEIFSKFFLAQFYLGLRRLKDSLRYRDEISNMLPSYCSQAKSLSKKFVANWNALGWNLSIFLLKTGDLENGWRLFDHGLQVPTNSPQKWQRALRKPLNTSFVPLWRGEALATSSLLLLGEQGIGDSMMFLSLLPSLLIEAKQIYLYVEPRLRPIYSRSFPALKVVDEAFFADSHMLNNIIDYQIPLGSICQYRFPNTSSYSTHSQILLSDSSVTNTFRKRHYDGRPLVGISWQGGGQKKIIDQKTIPLRFWKSIISDDRFKFVSLQYGVDEPHLKKFHKETGLNVFHDDDVDSMRDMDRWLSQVDAMDLVISVANTSIHGAAGLNKPTLCFLSKDADWRWINQDIYQGSYWYHSVDVAEQSSNGDWSSAIKFASQWLSCKLN